MSRVTLNARNSHVQIGNQNLLSVSSSHPPTLTAAHLIPFYASKPPAFRLKIDAALRLIPNNILAAPSPHLLQYCLALGISLGVSSTIVEASRRAAALSSQ